jgi:hypothetical protein
MHERDKSKEHQGRHGGAYKTEEVLRIQSVQCVVVSSPSHYLQDKNAKAEHV